MKTRLLSCLCLMGAFAASAFSAEPAAASMHATTITKSAIKIGNGSFALVKGTKLEILGREGDTLIVRFRSTQGKIPLAETDFPADALLPEATPVAAAPAAAATAPVKPTAPVTPASVPAGFTLLLQRMEADDLTLDELVAGLRQIRHAPKPVMLHCWHGSDRTGSIVAAYRIVFQGWTSAAALDELRFGGFGYHEKTFPNIITLFETLDTAELRRRVLE